jgi:hemin uptake protein HemP
MTQVLPQPLEAMAPTDHPSRAQPRADAGPAGTRAERPLPAAASGRRWISADLFGALTEIEIEHGAAVYRLRQTSLGKLILTK